MSGRLPALTANFSRDLRRLSLIVALSFAGLSLAGLFTVAVRVDEWLGYRDSAARTLKQIAATAAETESLSAQRTNEPDAAAINALRKRIVSLNALDFGTVPSVARTLAVFEQLMPPGVALQSLDYDRSRGALELVAVSEIKR